MSKELIISNIFIEIGDITKYNVDAIVNAANNTLLGGGGVDGAIHRAAGPSLLEESRKLNGCMSGFSKLTKGYNLPAKFVIHTVGPIYRDGNHNEKNTLIGCYNTVLAIAKKHDMNSVAFPAISTGVYNYPKNEACVTAIDTVASFMEKNNYFPKIFFVLFDNENYMIYKNTFDKIKETI